MLQVNKTQTALNQTGSFQKWREISAVQGIVMSYCRHSGLQISLIHSAALKAPNEDRGCALHLLRPMDLAHQKNNTSNYCCFSLLQYCYRGCNKLFPLNLEVLTLSRQPVVYIYVTLGDTWTESAGGPVLPRPLQ